MTLDKENEALVAAGHLVDHLSGAQAGNEGDMQFIREAAHAFIDKMPDRVILAAAEWFHDTIGPEIRKIQGKRN